MFKSIIPVFFLITLFITGCGLEEIVGKNEENQPSDKSDLLVDTMVEVNSKSAQITLDDGFSLFIPQGTSSDSFSVTIDDSREIKSSSGLKIINSYDIELSCGTFFDPPLNITIPFDPGDINQKDSLRAVYYNENSKTWVIFDSCRITGNSAQITTDHLTVVGLAEFISTGGYAHKFTGVPGIVVYYNLNGDDAVMSSSGYGELLDQPYHIQPGDPLYSPVYIQDIAFALKDARKKFADSPFSLKSPETDEDIEVYVKDLDGSDGSFGTVSGALYINNTVTAPTKPAGISNRQCLEMVVAHEYLHFIQDYYYVVNNAGVGLWWLEAIATQADRMVWDDKYVYGESEIYSIESNTSLIENLAKSWDDCSMDPNWYLAGCFLNYMGWHRDGDKLNIASVLKSGGSQNAVYRLVLNSEIKSQLSSNVGDEFSDYVRYLFETGNKNLSALSDGIAFVEVQSGFNSTLERNSQSKKESYKIEVPYLGAKMATLKNSGTDTLKTIIRNLSGVSSVNVFMCSYDPASKVMKDFTPVTEDSLESVIGEKNGKQYILMINSSFATTDTVTLELSPAFLPLDTFHFINVSLEASREAIHYSDGSSESNFNIGFLSDGTSAFRSIESSFKNDGTFSIIAEKVTGSVKSGGIDEEAQRYDSTRITVSGTYEGNVLYDVEFYQYHRIVTPDDAFVTNKNGTDTLVTSTFNEGHSLRIDTITLDQSSSYYTYYKIWSGDKIRPQIGRFGHDFVKYAYVDSKVDTLIPHTKTETIEWDAMVTMQMLCGKK